MSDPLQTSCSATKQIRLIVGLGRRPHLLASNRRAWRLTVTTGATSAPSASATGSSLWRWVGSSGNARNSRDVSADVSAGSRSPSGSVPERLAITYRHWLLMMKRAIGLASIREQERDEAKQKLAPSVRRSRSSSALTSNYPARNYTIALQILLTLQLPSFTLARNSKAMPKPRPPLPGQRKFPAGQGHGAPDDASKRKRGFQVGPKLGKGVYQGHGTSARAPRSLSREDGERGLMKLRFPLLFGA